MGWGVIATVFRSEDFDKGDRFEVWREMSCRSATPLEIRTAHTDDFPAVVHAVELAPLHVSAAATPPLEVTRTARHVRQGDTEVYQLQLCTRGALMITQAGRNTGPTTGRWVMHSSSLPHLWQTKTAPRCEGITVRVPRSLLPVPAARADTLLARPLSGQTGVGGLLFDCATRLTSEANQYRPTDAARLGTVLLDLVTALLAHELERESDVPPGSHRRVLVMRVQAFILGHLGDPDLTLSTIAAAHHISVSYLHRLFQQQEMTVAGWLRQQRLERCRRDLADPALRHVAIHRIAARWGFSHPAQFSRAFRTAYGIPPRDYRARPPAPGA